jgi:hypothetical protein
MLLQRGWIGIGAIRGTGRARGELDPCMDGISISTQRADTDLVAEASLYPFLKSWMPSSRPKRKADEHARAGTAAPPSSAGPINPGPGGLSLLAGPAVFIHARETLPLQRVPNLERYGGEGSCSAVAPATQSRLFCLSGIEHPTRSLKGCTATPPQDICRRGLILSLFSQKKSMFFLFLFTVCCSAPRSGSTPLRCRPTYGHNKQG